MSASVSEDSVLPPAQEDTFTQASADFAAELLHHSFQTNENTTLSPYSVLTALAMAAAVQTARRCVKWRLCSACPLTG